MGSQRAVRWMSWDIADMNSMMIFAVMALLLPILLIYNRRKKK
jgi:hypothetical protein